MKHPSEKDFSELKETTKQEIAELIINDNYVAEASLNPGKHKDLSDFSNLSPRTQEEVMELIAKDKYTLKSDGNEFDGFRIMKIQEFLAEQERKMKEFFSREQRVDAKDREFVGRDLLLANLGFHEGLEDEVKRHGELKINELESVEEIEGLDGAAYVQGMLDRVVKIAQDTEFYEKKGDFIKFDKR